MQHEYIDRFPTRLYHYIRTGREKSLTMTQNYKESAFYRGLRGFTGCTPKLTQSVVRPPSFCKQTSTTEVDLMSTRATERGRRSAPVGAAVVTAEVAGSSLPG